MAEQCLSPSAALLGLAGGARAATLRQRVREWKRLRQYLLRVKSREWPTSLVDVVDYLLARAEEPCGWTVPRTVQATLAWFEKAAGIPLANQLAADPTLGRVVDELTATLARPGHRGRRAPRLPSILIAALEITVMARGKPGFWRVLAWIRLLKVWGSLRWDDLHRISPGAMRIPGAEVEATHKDEDNGSRQAGGRGTGPRRGRGLGAGAQLGAHGLRATP